MRASLGSSIRRRRFALAARLGLLLTVAATATGCALRASGDADAYSQFERYEGRRISDVDFPGSEPFHEDSLMMLVQTKESSCSLLGLPICVPFTSIGRDDYFLDVGDLAGDVRTLELFYRIEGYFGTTVSPDVAEDGEDVQVVFSIARTEPVILDSLTVTGTDEVTPPASMRAALALQPGDTFNLTRFAQSADTIQRILQRAGHAYAQVLRNYGVNTAGNRAVAELNAIPGPAVTVDSVIIRGATHLGERGARRFVTLREGELLRRDRLTESQRNLYGLELVQFAGVSIAPDSLQLTPADSTSATVVVSVAEAPLHQVDAALGFGTVECGRAEVRWVDRNFTGGARRLVLSGSLSKIGISGPLDAGADRSICRAFEGDSAIGNRLDYRVSAQLTQPYFLSPDNRLNVTLFADRVSEPSVYQRSSIGARFDLTRRMGIRSVLSPELDIVRSRTIASPALYCVAFQVCEPEVIDSLGQARFTNTIGASLIHDRTDEPLNPTRGSRYTTSLKWATPLLGSETRFIRWLGDATYHRPLRPGWVGAGVLRLGNFFKTVTLDATRNFLPPEERFYAGGPSTVRGLSRNELGPGIWVTAETREQDGVQVPDSSKAVFIPVGGTSLIVASAEVRFPSPFLPRLLRLAAFVDAGALGTGAFWDLEPRRFRLTPGAGLRLTTPVGPVRVDVGYNPYDPPVERLYYSDTATGRLVQLRDEFSQPPPSFWNRFRVHLAVGQPF